MSKLVFKKPKAIKDDYRFTYCPGCDHGVAIRIIAEALEEMELCEKTIIVSSIGCSVFLNDYFDLDIIEAPHGRALAVATGVKRAKPDKFVLTYQGDGDFASIGLGESLHAIARGENVTTVCINNTTYGMTGGQGGPTTVLGQITSTTPQGRKAEVHGYPIKIAELCAVLEGAGYVARTSLDSSAQIENTKKAIKKAFEIQENGLGASLVEVLATCPTNWKLSPQDSHKRVKEELFKIFPLGVYKHSFSRTHSREQH
ncbi:pyruvate:ferredoxin oxidoreductase and related 2-oxoacid:ferredoxin oxidoreductases, beta subunit [Candidatus Gastranaerophilus sp. (ex Termes propinquus)]|nr:pyruvate:ferredoxin oxidoreductase and related 2-oxoacid:ferredoxin oxidoreductases, beta subunit [Candidatus Gastranaerophilus sp. (ex Termes propinquus)]